MSTPFLIDTDMGSDDAVALIMALQSSAVDVNAVTTVAGNVGVQQATQNALTILDLCGADVPVYAGAATPVMQPHSDAHWFHGRDGLSGEGYATPERTAAESHAVQAIIETAQAHDDLVLVTLGPLTNIALALKQAPEIVSRIARCVVMGGAASTYGNVTPAAEYNIWCDPEAARIVFHSGLPVEMVGWEFCIGEYALTDDEIAQIRAFDNAIARFALDCNQTAIESFYRQTGQRGLSLPDPVTMAVALDRSIATQEMHYVEIETASPLTRGMTVVDKLHVADDPRNQHIWQQALKADAKIAVTWDIDSPRWKTILFDLLRG